jgi:hypothetical protein
VGLYITLGGVAFLLWSNRDQLTSLFKRSNAVLSVPSRTSPDIHDAVDAVRTLQSYFESDPEASATISKAAGLKLFHVEGVSADVKTSN